MLIQPLTFNRLAEQTKNTEAKRMKRIPTQATTSDQPKLKRVVDFRTWKESMSKRKMTTSRDTQRAEVTVSQSTIVRPLGHIPRWGILDSAIFYAQHPYVVLVVLEGGPWARLVRRLSATSNSRPLPSPKDAARVVPPLYLALTFD